VAQQPYSVLGLSFSRFLDHAQLDTHTHTHARTHTQSLCLSLFLCRTTPNEKSAHFRARYLNNWQRTQDTNTHALSGIRTLDPSNPAAADLRLRPHGRRNLLFLAMTWVICSLDRIIICKYVLPIICRADTDRLCRVSNPGLSNSLGVSVSTEISR
jgi:hypothetical protein